MTSWRSSSLFPTRTVILARRGHPLADRTDLTLAELANYPWIVSSRRIGDTGPLPLLDVFHSAGITPPTRLLYSDAVSAAMGLLVRGDFLTLSVTYAVPLTVVSEGAPIRPLSGWALTGRRHRMLPAWSIAPEWSWHDRHACWPPKSGRLPQELHESGFNFD